MMKWTKPSAETIAYFERIAPGPPIEARRMFGMPARFLNGHMLVSVFGDAFMLHLSAADRLECIAAGARPFAPLGRNAKEYVEITPGHFDDHTLKVWIARGMRYLGSLPPKLKVPVPKRVTAGRRGAEMGRRRAETERGVASAKGPTSKRGGGSVAAASKPRARTVRAVKGAGVAGQRTRKAAARQAPARKSAAPAKAKQTASKKARGKRR